MTMPERIDLAADYFERAARAEHMGALTALGDLYAFGVYGISTSTVSE